MDSDDVVDPGDAAVQALLALTAENTDDPQKHDLLLDAILTVPPLKEWPLDCREKLLETCRFIKDLSRDLSQRSQTLDAGDDSHRGLQTRCEPHEHEPYGDTSTSPMVMGPESYGPVDGMAAVGAQTPGESGGMRETYRAPHRSWRMTSS